MNYYVLTEKPWVKIVWMSSWGIWLHYPGIKVLATANSILQQTARLVIGRCFKITNSTCIFERRSVTSPTTFVYKGRDCHWDQSPIKCWVWKNRVVITALILQNSHNGEDMYKPDQQKHQNTRGTHFRSSSLLQWRCEEYKKKSCLWRLGWGILTPRFWNQEFLNTQ